MQNAQIPTLTPETASNYRNRTKSKRWPSQRIVTRLFSGTTFRPEPPPPPPAPAPAPAEEALMAESSGEKQMEETASWRSGGRGRLRETRLRAQIRDLASWTVEGSRVGCWVCLSSWAMARPWREPRFGNGYLKLNIMGLKSFKSNKHRLSHTHSIICYFLILPSEKNKRTPLSSALSQ